MSSDYSVNKSMGMLIRRVQSAMHQRLFSNFKKAGLEVSPEQWALMIMLTEKEGLTQGDIAQRISRNTSSITRMIDNLSDKGLLERRPHETDRRANLIYLTKKGKEMQQQVMVAAAQTQQEARKNIDDNELEVCRQVLERMIKNLE